MTTVLSGVPAAIAETLASTPEQQAVIDKALAGWEKRTSEANTYRCNFTMLHFDRVFDPRKPGEPEEPMFLSKGEIICAAQNKVAARETQVRRSQLNPKTGKFELMNTGAGDHNTFDGKSLYFVDHQKMTVSKAQTDAEGGVNFGIWKLSRTVPALDFVLSPFGFPVSAYDLKSRFSIRLVTSPDGSGQTWLEMTPRDPKKSLWRKTCVILGADSAPAAICLEQGENDREVILIENGEFDPPDAFPADTFAPHPDGYKLIGN